MRRSTSGMTLIEIVIAMAISAILTLALVSATITAARVSSNMPYDVYATQIISKTAEDLRKENYDLVGTTGLPLYNSAQTFYSDPDDHSRGTSFTVSVRFKGFGLCASGSSSTTLKAVLPAGDPGWTANEWQGSVVMLKDGAGSGQCAYVKSNTADTLTITRNLDGSGSLAWIQTPTTTTYFEIGGGKTVVITASWSNGRKNFSKSMTTMLLR
ncbi:MAG: prepilin-type N-terminal cleavage/methylation domain-containing protein [Candidatus Sumerlaeota bacterium]|nr:prepilin-type N-terminal cleavage/methylation domain-containing protein [Candidatus Sumerlaeota bacterium]